LPTALTASHVKAPDLWRSICCRTRLWKKLILVKYYSTNVPCNQDDQMSLRKIAQIAQNHFLTKFITKRFPL
jgi:hypothetical protein